MIIGVVVGVLCFIVGIANLVFAFIKPPTFVEHILNLALNRRMRGFLSFIVDMLPVSNKDMGFRLVMGVASMLLGAVIAIANFALSA